MTNIFIIHGVLGSPEESWFPWLRQELRKLGHHVIVPQFPTPKNQTLTEWWRVMDQYKEFLTLETIVVGHSVGVAFLLNVIEKYPVKAAFFVSAFVGKAGNHFDDSMKTFSQKTFDWPAIKKNCKNFIVFHSNNDPYVKLEKGQELAKLLGVGVHLIKGAGHFNSAAGYDRFEKLLKEVKLYL